MELPRDIILVAMLLGTFLLSEASHHRLHDGARRRPVPHHPSRGVVVAGGVAYQSFPDYLLSIAKPEEVVAREKQASHSTTTPKPEDNSTTTVSTPAPSPTPVPDATSSLDILGYFRDVPREHWSCCMLGKLAGDKGFNCHAQNYARDMMTRNVNRAQNRKMNAASVWAVDIMGTFQRCVHRESSEFHKCCYAATQERRERRRWRQYQIVKGEGNLQSTLND